MTDLHGWITQHIDKVEQRADQWHDIECKIRATVRDADDAAVMFVVTCGCSGPANVRLRCEADRRILARHRLDPSNWHEPACHGCRTYSDQDMAYTDNLNECPELLDLGYAHGLTGEILTSLDQPETPPRPEHKPRGGILPPGIGATADVPPALRGPNWKGRP